MGLEFELLLCLFEIYLYICDYGTLGLPYLFVLNGIALLLRILNQAIVFLDLTTNG